MSKAEPNKSYKKTACDLEECVVGDILHYTTRGRHRSVVSEEDHSILSKEVKKQILGRCYGLSVCFSTGAGGPQQWWPELVNAQGWMEMSR